MKPLPAWSKVAKHPLAVTVGALAIIAVPGLVPMPKCLIWNASASVPIGLYAILPGAPVQVGDLAVSDLPADVRTLAAKRHYLPPSVLLIKPVSATAGMTVCRKAGQISISGVVIARAKSADRSHRAMPVWSGCRRIADHEIFLMNPAVSDSFDGRYFGPTPVRLVHGRAIPVFTIGTPPL